MQGICETLNRFNAFFLLLKASTFKRPEGKLGTGILPLLCLCLGLVAMPSEAQRAPAWAQQPVHQVEGMFSYRLPNGLQLILYPNNTKASTTINLTVNVGSRHEGYGETGMAHLLEHLVFKGSPKFPKGIAELSSRGFRVNGTTSWDRTNYFASFPRSDENTQWMIQWLGDVLVNAYIRRQDLDSEMTVVRNEFERGENNPVGVLYQQVFATAYTWHNYGKAIIGTRSDIENVSIERLKRFYSHHYRPDNAALLVSGAFDRDKVIAWVQEAFGAIDKPERALEPTYTVEPVQEGARALTLRRVGEAPAIVLSYHVPSALHQDFPAMVLATHMMGGPNNRISERIVKKGLAASLWSWPRSAPEPSNVIFALQLKSDQATDKARQALLELTESIAREPFTEAELSAAKAYFLTQYEQMLADPERVAYNLSEAIALGDWRMLFQQRDRIAASKLEDVNRVAADFWLETNRTLGVFEPEQKPMRSPEQRQATVAEAMQGFAAKTAIDQGEAFEVSPSHIKARLRKDVLAPALTLQSIRKRNASNLVVLQANLRYGNLKDLQHQSDAAGLAIAMLSRGIVGQSKKAYAEAMTALKATWGIQGGAEGLTLSLRLPADRFEEGLSLLFLALSKPAFEQAEFEELKASAIASIESSRQDPQAIAFRTMSAKLSSYPKGDPRYVPSFEESIQTLKTMQLHEVKAFWDRFVRPGPMAVSVIGDLSAERLHQALMAFWKQWNLDRPPLVGYERIERPALDLKPQAQRIMTPEKKNAIWLAQRRFELGDNVRSYQALRLAIRIFSGGGSPTGRLWDRVREKEGLSYGVGGSLSGGEPGRAASLMFYAIFAPQNLERLQQLMREEFERAVAQGFDASELEKAKQGLEAEINLAWAQESVLAGTLNWLEEQSRTVDHLQAMRDLRTSIQLEEVNEAFRRYVRLNDLVTIMAGDFTAKKNP
ncbi:MAG: insulinase family protein [Betaproteobacteria bacterium]|jgi:zinc protease|nr:insulinase family protein [Betaproteobacteria bacterium]NBQ94321.1 insulinase family protein [Betaproteobacteria bacterium]NBY54860.1 insulinase family protein [Betaproteobacteria bacterium]NCY06071.1 insulinase family protein [Betaproteobacteria bacterium]